jgi:2-oxoglutarate dehydrogenase E2 component (dihydrolipoamide succinyltransferase)
MTIEIKSPTFPESVADGTVANWVKKEGESVDQDEIIAEIETDKVVLEVVAPSNGVLTKIIKHEGDIVNSAEIIGEFDETAVKIKEEKISKEVNLQSSSAEEDDPKIKDDINHKKIWTSSKKTYC